MSSIDDYFNKILIINLDESVDRWNNITEVLKKANVNNYERIQAIRLPTLDGISPSRYGRLVSPLQQHEYYRRGITSANMSHVKCITTAKERNYNNVLILEDDANIREDANKLFEKIIPQLEVTGWDMLYLGSNNQPKENIISVTENLVKGQNLLACHAYAVKNNLFQKIITEGLEYGSELDNYYKFCIQSNFKCLCTKPKLFWQNDGESITAQKFTDIEKYTRD